MPKSTSNQASIDYVLTGAYLELKKHDPHTDTYATILERIIRIEKLKVETQPKRISPDTLALIGANIAGIVLIISHEHASVITTKAMSLLLKPR